jgi:hypothetical protein
MAMDPQSVAEGIARQLARVWAIHRDPAFVDYLRQSFGCEPLMPVAFSGVFVVQVEVAYFFPDSPRDGPMVERVWLTDDAGFRLSSLGELQSAQSLQSDNPLVIYDPSHTRYQRASRVYTCLHESARFRFAFKDDNLAYHEDYGHMAVCRKVGKLVVGDGVNIQNVRTEWTAWPEGWKD